MTEYEKFTRLIAKKETGSAPSVSFFEELILKARKAIEKEKKMPIKVNDKS